MRTFIAASTLICSLHADSVPSSSDQVASLPPFVRGTPFDAGNQPGDRIWGDAEYLYLWTRNSSLPVPIATTGSSTDTEPAALGQPGTQVLFGNESIHNGALSGFRLSLRSWLDAENNYAIEGSGFYLPEKKSTVFSQQSSEVLGVPFNNVASFPLSFEHGGWSGVSPGETALLLGFDSLNFIGDISATSATQLWSVEVNGLFHFLKFPTFRLSALGGASYTDLSESLNFRFYNITSQENVFLPAILKDHFGTHNEIYAGQVGLRGEWSDNWLFVSFLAKLGLGGAVQSAHISGSFSDPVPDLYYTYGVGQSGGVFSQPTNTGKHTRGRFEVIPSATVRFGVNLLRGLRISCGYDILFLNNVLRPGDQIDRSINETQAGSASGKNPVLSGPSRPKALMNGTSYWAQGINAGIEFRF